MNQAESKRNIFFSENWFEGSEIRRFVAFSIFSLFFASNPWVLSQQIKGEQELKGSPNILIIVADDQSPFDLPIYEKSSKLQIPNIRSLADEGMTIRNAYHMGSWTGAVCTASRHMIMTGRSVWRIPSKRGRFKNPNEKDPTLVPPGLENSSLPAVFNRAGYQTMRTCKKGNSYAAANRQFQIVHDKTRRDPEGTRWHANQVLSFLDQRAQSEKKKPFLVYLGFSHPHDPRNGTADLLRKYGAVNVNKPSKKLSINSKTPKLPQNYLPGHPFDNGVMKIRDELRVKGVWDRRDEETIRNEVGRQFACSESIDNQVGRVLKRLKEVGEWNNTYIIYTSDHGIAIGRHGLQGKQNLYEHSWRVPMIIRGPGIKPASKATGNVYLSDLLSTICELAKIKTPETNLGKSFGSVLFGNKQKIRDILYGVYSGNSRQIMRCLRKGDWKLIQYKIPDREGVISQLFNLRENPYELLKQHGEAENVTLLGRKPSKMQRNLADDPQFLKIRRDLEAELLTQQRKLNDPYTK